MSKIWKTQKNPKKRVFGSSFLIIPEGPESSHHHDPRRYSHHECVVPSKRSSLVYSWMYHPRVWSFVATRQTTQKGHFTCPKWDGFRPPISSRMVTSDGPIWTTVSGLRPLMFWLWDCYTKCITNTLCGTFNPSP